MSLLWPVICASRCRSEMDDIMHNPKCNSGVKTIKSPLICPQFKGAPFISSENCVYEDFYLDITQAKFRIVLLGADRLNKTSKELLASLRASSSVVGS